MLENVGAATRRFLTMGFEVQLCVPETLEMAEGHSHVHKLLRRVAEVQIKRRAHVK